MFDLLASGMDQFLSLSVFAMIGIGSFIGLLVGVLPGLGPLMGIILLLPVAYYMEPVAGMALLISIYVAGSCGGAISAILLRIPGTPLAAATLLDGYPMASNGRAGDAIGIAISSSAIGGILSGLVLVFFSPMLAEFALNFGPPEYFALAITGLVSISVVSEESTAKGLLCGALGFMFATVGTDPLSMAYRFTFDNPDMLNGFHIVSVVVGLFAISEALIQIESGKLDDVPQVQKLKISFRTLFLTLKHKVNLVRSSMIGTFFGTLPGAGGIISAFTAYAVARSRAKPEEDYGNGAEGGVVATESANNACCGGALIPTLALAVPGDAACAVLMGALLLLGLQPGPQMFSINGDIVGGIFASYLVANIFLLILGVLMAPLFVSVLRVKKKLLVPVVVILSAIGTYALQSSVFDLWVMFAFGVVGFVFRKAGYPIAPIVIGMILGPLAEGNFRRSLLISQDGYSIFLERPIGTTILIINVLLILYVMFAPLIKKKFLRTKAEPANA